MTISFAFLTGNPPKPRSMIEKSEDDDEDRRKQVRSILIIKYKSKE